MVPPVWQLQLRLLRTSLRFGVGKLTSLCFGIGKLNFLCDSSGRNVPVGLHPPNSWKSLNCPDLGKGLREEASHRSWFCSSFCCCYVAFDYFFFYFFIKVKWLKSKL